MSLFGSSGIRGVANVDVTPDLCLALGKVLGDLYGDVVVGRDSRTTGPMLVAALTAGVLSAGGRVTDAGLVSTPTLARAARDHACGVAVTASHNPAPYNGLKLWNPEGMAFTEAQQEEVETALVSGRHSVAEWHAVASVVRDTQAVDRHVDAIVAAIGECRAKVVVDCGCGATGAVSPLALRALGCDVVALNAQPDGHFPARDPEPSEANLAVLREAVVASGADLGVAHDGDGDRMVAVDETGAYVGGDALLPLLALHEAKRSLVVPVDASMVLDDLLPDVRIHRTRVGDVFVAQEIARRKADFGGEPSGTWIFPKETMCPDGVYAAAYLAALVGRGRGLRALVADLPKYPLLRGSVPYAAARAEDVARRLEDAFGTRDDCEVTTLDGWRLQFDDGWALVRLSGTETTVRILAEAREAARAKEIYAATLAAVKGVVA